MTAEGKTLDVPRSYSFGGVAVGRWLENQRLVRAGKKKGRLTAAQAARLDKIGMNWKKRLELAWGERLCFGPAVPRLPQRPAGAGPL